MIELSINFMPILSIKEVASQVNFCVAINKINIQKNTLYPAEG